MMRISTARRGRPSASLENGDVLLKAAATRLLACVRKSDTVARMGGDEFTVIITEMKAAEDAEHVAKEFLNLLHSLQAE